MGACGACSSGQQNGLLWRAHGQRPLTGLGRRVARRCRTSAPCTWRCGSASSHTGVGSCRTCRSRSTASVAASHECAADAEAVHRLAGRPPSSATACSCTKGSGRAASVSRPEHAAAPTGASGSEEERVNASVADRGGMRSCGAAKGGAAPAAAPSACGDGLGSSGVSGGAGGSTTTSAGARAAWERPGRASAPRR